MFRRYILTFLLACFLIGLLSACNMDTAETAQTTASVSASPDDTEAADVSADSSAAVSTSPSPTPTPSSSPREPAPNSAPPTPSPSAVSLPGICRGVWKDGVYTNRFSGVRFVLPEGWEVLTDQELAEYYDVSPEVFDSEENWLNQTQNVDIAFDTMIVETGTNNSITLFFQRIAEDEEEADATTEIMWETMYAGIIKENLGADKSYDPDFSLPMLDFNRAVHLYDEVYNYSVYVFFKYKMSFMIVAIVAIDDLAGKTVNEVVDQFGLSLASVLGASDDPLAALDEHKEEIDEAYAALTGQ